VRCLRNFNRIQRGVHELTLRGLETAVRSTCLKTKPRSGKWQRLPIVSDAAFG
jgi:hypothetical protein